MGFFAAFAKIGVVLWFLVMMSVFVGSRITIFSAAVRQHQDNKQHARWYCNVCNEGNFVENAGDYGFNCYSACALAHDVASMREIGWKAVCEQTYLCLFWPCSDIGWKAVLLIIVLVYGFRYSLSIVNNQAQGKSSPLWFPCRALAWIASKTFAGAIAVFGALEKADDVPKYKHS